MNTQDISKNANNISLNAAAVAAPGRLCEIWPIVKEGLQLLAAAIKNPLVKLTIEGLIAAGDAIIAKICK